MALYSHEYQIKVGGKSYKGKLQFKSGQAYSQLDESEHKGLTVATQTNIATLMTAVSTLNTALGAFESLSITPTSTEGLGKV
jgi:hypothetical protein